MTKKRKLKSKSGASSSGAGASSSSVVGDEPSSKKAAQKMSFSLVHRIREKHNKQLFSLSVNHINPKFANIFATTGGNKVTLYEMKDKTTEVIQVYEDENPDEDYFASAWSYFPEEGTPILAIGGILGVIRIIDCMLMFVHRVFIGHGNAINDLKFHPTDPNLLLSASKDEALRLWNVHTNSCVAIFSGDKGHRGEVLSIDFHLDGQRFVSAGMDNCIKIWTLSSCAEGVTASYQLDKAPPGPSPCKPTKTVMVQHPEFSTNRVHANYVDCVRWFGDLLLTKSTHNKIILWKPDTSSPHRSIDSISIFQEYFYSACDIWFVRFELDPLFQTLAVGNLEGKVFLWDMKTLDAKIACTLTHTKLKCTVRQTAFSRNGKTLLFCCDDGSVWRWDKNV